MRATSQKSRNGHTGMSVAIHVTEVRRSHRPSDAFTTMRSSNPPNIRFLSAVIHIVSECSLDRVPTSLLSPNPSEDHSC